MTRGGPEPDPYADAGDRGRDDRPAVPGWNVDQDWYGEAREDTGWHLDLSDVNWGQNPGPRGSTLRFGADGSGDQTHQDGNVLGPPPVTNGRPAEAPRDWDQRSPRRPGRHSRPHAEAAPTLPRATQPGRRGRPGRQSQPGQGAPAEAHGAPAYGEAAEPYAAGPAGPRSYQTGDLLTGPDYAPTQRNPRPAPHTDPGHTGPDYAPTQRNPRPAPRTGDYQTGAYDTGDDDRRVREPGPDSYQPPAYGPASGTSQTRPYLPESYQRQAGRPADGAQHPGDPRNAPDIAYTGDTQHVRAHRPAPRRSRAYQPLTGDGPGEHEPRPPGGAGHGGPDYRDPGHGEPDYSEPDYSGPDDYETGAYDPALDPAFDPVAYAADYQTDVFELTGYGQAVPGLPPQGLPPPPRTRPPAAPAGQRGATTTRAPVAAAAVDNVSVVRSSGVMAAGTLGSRLTGFLRTLVQNFGIGVVGIGQAYNLSNTLPNVVYNLALGGILTSVVVPLIVAAANRDSDRGRGYDQRMFTLGTLALAAITLVATALAAPIVHLYSGSQVTGNLEHLAIIFALFFIPQIFFYGISSLIGAILNSRGSFAAPMWTPIVNNVVVIAVFGLYIALAGVHKSAATISGTDVALLGLGTTLGIVAQTVALVPALRRVGFRWHPRLDFRRSEVAEIGRMGGWMFCYIAATQVAFLITTKVAGDTTSGISDYNYAWLLFQLPYAVVGISVITALLPRMSAHASERRLGLVRTDFSTGVRLAATIVVPCSLILAVLGPALGLVFFAHGATQPSQARYVGVVFAVFCLGLLPYMIFQLQLRVFYALHDSKTPAMIGLATMLVNIVANLVALAVLSKGELVAGLGVGFGLANLAGLVLAWRILRVRLRGLDGYRIGRSLVRMHAATLPAALLAVLVALVSSSAYVVVIIGGGLAMAVYLVFSRVLRIEELAGLTRSVRARLVR